MEGRVIVSKSIYAAKININQNIFNYNVNNLIPLIRDALLMSVNHSVETKTNKWAFVEVNETSVEERMYIIGKLCKIKKESIEKEFDEEKFKVEKRVRTNIVRESSFLLDISSEIVILEENSDITKEEFIKYFALLCYRIKQTIGQIKIEFYPKSSDIDSLLRNVEKVYYAKFNIIPANYTSKNGFKKLDDLLKDEKISGLNMTIRNNDGDIDLSQGTIFNQGVEMVKNAYGKFKINIKNKDSKSRKTIDSECTIYKKIIENNETPFDYIKAMANLVVEIIKDNNIHVKKG